MRSMQKLGIGGRRARWGASTCAVAALVLAMAGTAAAAPTVSVTGVSQGATLAPGSLALGATASTGTTQVKWFLDGLEVGWDGAAPWEASVASTKLAAGSHTSSRRPPTHTTPGAPRPS